MKDFWERCVDAGCVVVPVMTYTRYGDDGNLHSEFKSGIRFAAMISDPSAVAEDDYWFMVDDQHEGPLYATPEDALSAFISKAKK